MNANTAMTMSNVTVSDKMLDGRRKSDFAFVVERPLNEIMWKLVVENPTWEFKIEGSRNLSTVDNVMNVGGFTVLKDGEQIGNIGRTYRYARSGASEYVFCIESNAIKKERERGYAYETKDAKKALSAIKKTFIPKTLNDRIADARELAKKAVNQQASRKYRKHASLLDDLLPMIKVFALKEQGQEFAHYLSRHSKSNMLEDLNEAQSEMMTTAAIQAEFVNDNTSLVLLANGKYVVKTGDDVQVYDDNTFPQAMRSKLGMLKLVEPEQMIEGVGCRATIEIFVLVTEPLELA